ncbi:TetR/AcrR family transcriptional regulator [Alkalibacter mobilis]|uniref:TetR/AcrR family transcriptional regulator n=1 Tax=Alkalibacter mobilis TaxID=2787712 RepID=UPI00189E5689|nr:TetR/AcrR family transcriptional regulator [Alkalibacter mobilis]MBF7096827.1 helix-turn-helix transcriptional regulator [Alkalibacter mobilis]
MENNNKKHKIILENAKEIFYELGYTNATMDKIAKRCGIQKQLITYYFATKFNLGQEVQNDISVNILSVFERKGLEVGVTNTLITNAASAVWTSRYYKQDPHAHRFFNELIRYLLFNIDFISSEKARHYHLSKIDFDKNSIEGELDYISSRYASRGILYHYCNGDINVDQDVFEKYYYYQVLRPYHADESFLESSYKEAIDLLDRITIKIKPNFVIE